MKYIEFETIDKYCRMVADKDYNGLPYGFDKEDIKDAFHFMQTFEKASRFNKVAMEASKSEALKVLKEFEDTCKAKKEALIAEKKEKIRLREAAKAQAPIIWDKKILPKFDALIEEINNFAKTPGYEYFFLSETISKKIEEVEAAANIQRKEKAVFIR